MIKNYIGHILKKIRELRGLTQKALGQRCNLPQSRVAQYEMGNRIPKDSQLEQFAQILDVNIQAFRNIDINTSDKEAIYHLLFQLEEKGLFSVEKILPRMTYHNGQPQWIVEIPVDNETAIFFRTWAQLKQDPIPINRPAFERLQLRSDEKFPSNRLELQQLKQWEKIDLEHWKYDKSARKELNVLTENIDLKPTNQLLSWDLLTYEEALRRITNELYTFNDLTMIFRKLSSTNYPGEGIHENLYQIFKDGTIPDKFLYELFEKKQENGYPEIPRGPVREIYEKAMNDRKESEKE